MSSTDARRETESEAAQIIAALRGKGVQLWPESGELRYRAPRGILTSRDLEQLRTAKPQIISSLLKARSRREPVCGPLTFSQTARWDRGRMALQPTVRQIASATRLLGRLNLAVLRSSLAETVARHDALRTRIVERDGQAMQEVDAEVHCDLRVEDLSSLSNADQVRETQRLIDELIMAPVLVHQDPLSAVLLARIGEHEHVLIAVMEHIISDAFSMNVFLRDLFAIYVADMRGSAPNLSQIHMQPIDYARWQWSSQPAWVTKHAQYWEARLAGCTRLCFPSDRPSGRDVATGWGTVPLPIGRELKAALRQWSRSHRTTVVMSVFCVYYALVLRWCGVSDAVFRYQTDGRTAKVENSIGYFATALNLRLELGDNDTFLDLLQRVTAEYASAYEHSDGSYLDLRDPAPEFVRNTLFNWVSQEPRGNSVLLEGSVDRMVLCPMSFPHPLLKSLSSEFEPWILFYDSDEEVNGNFHYPRQRMSEQLMQEFARDFYTLLDALLKQPERPIPRIAALGMENVSVAHGAFGGAGARLMTQVGGQ